MGKLYPGAFEILKCLASLHELFLVSKEERGRKEVLESLGIKDFFRETVFTGKKTPEIFSAMVGDGKKVVVVGDRIKGEISIGNKLNYITVWIKQGKFQNEIPSHRIEEPSHTISDIRELEEILKKYE